MESFLASKASYLNPHSSYIKLRFQSLVGCSSIFTDTNCCRCCQTCQASVTVLRCDYASAIWPPAMHGKSHTMAYKTRSYVSCIRYYWEGTLSTQPRLCITLLSNQLSALSLLALDHNRRLSTSCISLALRTYHVSTNLRPRRGTIHRPTHRLRWWSL